MQTLPPLITLEPPPPPQRRRLDTDGSFEPIGVSEVPGEPTLRTNRFDFNTVEIEDLQADEFSRNFNTPLTDLNDLLIFEVRPFDPPMFGVLVGVDRNISPAADSKVFRWSEWFRSRTNRR